MKWWAICLGVGTALSLLAASWFPPSKQVIWNRTASAPTGLYWLDKRDFSYGDLVVVSSEAPAARWAESQGYVGRDWPLLKVIAGLPGDEICRHNERILINQAERAVAIARSSDGRALPRWSGCILLQKGQVFLLNSHANSLDGRYFGATDIQDVDGVAVLVLRF